MVFIVPIPTPPPPPCPPETVQPNCGKFQILKLENDAVGCPHHVCGRCC